jgi:lipid-A-disaccharide synthase
LSVRVLLSCGEPSGDLYAGALTRELRALSPDIDVFGMGGPQFVAAGGRQIADYRTVAVTGLVEPIARLPALLRTRRRLLASARATPPDIIVPIDFWGFNSRLARDLRRAHRVPVVYYVSPQFWASRPGRMATMREIATRVLVIFPFEEAMYREAAVPVDFVGHPLVDVQQPPQPRAAFLAELGLKPDAPTVAVLPGSRANEVRRILPPLVRAAGLVARRIAGVQFVVARAPNLDGRLFDDARGVMTVVEQHTDAVLASADVALTASGTATVQTALHDTPMVIVYRVSPATYFIGRRLLTVDTFGMVNLIAGRRIVPELIQDAFTPEAVAAEAVSMLTDRARVAGIRNDLEEVRRRLGGGGASRRAAETILRVTAQAAV